jgi:hypothetical protein
MRFLNCSEGLNDEQGIVYCELLQRIRETSQGFLRHAYMWIALHQPVSSVSYFKILTVADCG